jgi:hypothetical protein
VLDSRSCPKRLYRIPWAVRRSSSTPLPAQRVQLLHSFVKETLRLPPLILTGSSELREATADLVPPKMREGQTNPRRRRFNVHKRRASGRLTPGARDPETPTSRRWKQACLLQVGSRLSYPGGDERLPPPCKQLGALLRQTRMPTTVRPRCLERRLRSSRLLNFRELVYLLRAAASWRP